MSTVIERALRRQIDPGSVLPSVRLRPMASLCKSDYQNFKIYSDLNTVGAVVLHRWSEGNGRPVARAESMYINDDSSLMERRYAATLAILAMTSQEGRTLVSDEHGLATEDVATWCWLTGEGLAVIDRPFIPRPQLFRGSPVFDGMAYAPPVTLKG